MKMKRAWALAAAVVLSMSLALGTTLAYLTDTDKAVNVMTLGNVDIEQHEQERDANGNLKDFSQFKPAYPAVGPVKMDDECVNVNGIEYAVYTEELKNVVDKIVTVENTGKSDAFVRTIIAIEAPDYDPNNLIHYNCNTTGVSMSAPINAEIDGVKYVALVFTYPEALKPGETSVPSLMQLFLDAKTTNEDVAKFGETWDVLTLSQAVQAMGFDDAEAALNAGFGVVNDENLKAWFGQMGIHTKVEVANTQQLLDALRNANAGSQLHIVLTGDVEYETAAHHGAEDISPASSVIIDGQGKYKLTATGAGVTPIGDVNSDLTLKNLTVVDKSVSYAEDAWELTYLEMGGASLTCENVTFADPIMPCGEKAVFTDCTFTSNGANLYAVWMHNGDATFTNCTVTGYRGIKICDMYDPEVGTVVIDGCTFKNITKKPGVVIDDCDTQDMNIIIKNSTFIGTQAGDQGNYIYETDNTVPTLSNNTVVSDTVNNTQELNDALAAGSTAVYLGAGNYELPAAIAGKTVTLIGSGDDTVVDFTKAYGVSNANITFENMKFKGKNENVMSGFGIHGTSGNIVFKNCTFDGAVTNENYANVSYIGCTFTGTGYITTYAVPSAIFTNCTFDKADSRALLVYSHGNNPVKVTVENCTFKAAEKGYTGVPAWTAAVEVDTTNISSTGTTVTINGCNADANYNGIWRDKSAAGKDNAVITVDGVRVK